MNSVSFSVTVLVIRRIWEGLSPPPALEPGRLEPELGRLPVALNVDVRRFLPIARDASRQGVVVHQLLTTSESRPAISCSSARRSDSISSSGRGGSYT